MRSPDASRPPRRLRNRTMPPPAPAATEIPRWPKITATLNADGTGVLTIDGRDQPLEGADVDTARSVVLERVAATAATVGRPVRLHSSDPDGDWTLAVHPDGRVDELAARPAAVAPVMPAVAVAGSPPRPVGRAAVRSMRPPGSRRRRLAGRVAAGLGLLAGIAVVLALLITNGPATVVRDQTPRMPTRSAPPATDKARDTVAVAAHRARQAVDRARQRATLRRSVAARQARQRRAARRRAAARRSAPNARRATAPARRRARPARRTSPPPAPARTTPPARPAPATSASPQCGEFDLC